MVAFIKQYPLENRTARNILQIIEFEYTVWEFLSIIYESGWNKLTVIKDNKSFRQCILVQFNRTPTNNISRIFPLISLRSSQSVLAKSKFFKKNQVSNVAPPSLNWSYVQASKNQIIILMSINNIERVIAQFNIHITNINRLLKDIKLEICADFICSNNIMVHLNTNKLF